MLLDSFTSTLEALHLFSCFFLAKEINRCNTPRQLRNPVHCIPPPRSRPFLQHQGIVCKEEMDRICKQLWDVLNPRDHAHYEGSKCFYGVDPELKRRGGRGGVVAMAMAMAENCGAAADMNQMHVFFHEGMLEHDNGHGVFDTFEEPAFLDVLEPHPENAARIRNIRSILQRGPLAPFVTWHRSRPATVASLTSFHSPEYVQELVDADAAGGKVMCAGTRLSAGSWAAALLAAGAAQQAMQYVLDGHGLLAYALVRPPGHHAQPTQADGYCFLNNAGLAVQLARDQGCKRVAVVDIDVHYGNGTAEGFYSRDDVYTVSLHMHHGSWGASHPQTGLPDEAGAGAGAGFNMNVPLAWGTGDEGYEHAMAELVVPALSQFQPNMIVLVIGQDSSQLDPNGRMCLTMEGYRRIGQIVRDLADAFSGGRVLVVQEGGYQITYSAYCAHATLEGLLDLPRPLLADPMGCYPEDLSYSTARIAEIRKKLKGLKKVV